MSEEYITSIVYKRNHRAIGDLSSFLNVTVYYKNDMNKLIIDDCELTAKDNKIKINYMPHYLEPIDYGQYDIYDSYITRDRSAYYNIYAFNDVIFVIMHIENIHFRDNINNYVDFKTKKYACAKKYLPKGALLGNIKFKKLSTENNTGTKHNVKLKSNGIVVCRNILPGETLRMRDEVGLMMKELKI